MPVKIRLQRFGRKKNPFYHIVITDSRNPRDGKFIEKIGTYNPQTIPATIDINVDSAIDWMEKGAQPSDTARRILSFKGVLFKRHLLRGVKKGVLAADQVEVKWNEYLESHASAVASKKQAHDEKKAEARRIAKAPIKKEAPVAVEEAPVTEEAPATDEAPAAAAEEAPTAE
jgi:small subunit ribosomal protein S16